ncbi:putative peptidase M1, membrane alanine aminopeptidase [Curtobacterium citreum]|uniref:Aminopeptidase N n=1 Tax=Curtobacterium citreum TaxID=2036 RepID=A0ABT2HE41_9MICO|nr:M1 family metallopeptidase [Curtobacterium citreum]MCS6521480.1 M1 family metallopeptidase [Curtobacterium citreum]TQJ28337.1 peptidase M1-like protein [Curtobacterium citreum]GGL75911.1 putative peptidase M1, membrane alanine aminopeptidase [Curtobacterium citreum]
MKPNPDADPYTPHSGDRRWSALHHDLRLGYRVATNRLDATATITARALVALDRIVLDLHGLRVDRADVDGVRAAKVAASTHKLTVTPAEPIAAGAEFTLHLRYRGAPRPLRSPWGQIGWEELTDGVIVAAQPTGAPSWFPCNDRPDDKATYRFEITAETGYDVVANGDLLGREQARAGTTWTYAVTEPMATYLATVQIGRYRSTRLRGAVPPVTVHHPADLASAVRTDFGQVPEMLALYADRFGPYPFSSYGLVVTDDELEIPLEAHGLAVFGRNHVDGEHGTDRLIAHELAHQWFGNSLTVRRWQDIWLHEGFACYAEWLWSEHRGGDSADVLAAQHRQALVAGPQDLVVASPGARDMFDDRVYKRGALALHAVRRTVGDEGFFAGLRTLTDRYRHGNVVPEDVLGALADAAGLPVDAVRRITGPWVDEPGVPALPVVRPV